MGAYGGDCEEVVIRCINENGPAYLCDKSARSVKDYVLYQVHNNTLPHFLKQPSKL